MARYAEPADMLKRKDARDIGDLVSDTDQQVSPTNLLTDANLLQALDDASGDIEAALLIGGKYTVTQLSDLLGNSQDHLQRITCEIAMYHLLGRRPTQESERLEYYQKLRDYHLEPIRTGENVFNIVEHVNAGVISVDGPTTADYGSLNLVRDRVNNYFPGRALPNNR